MIDWDAPGPDEEEFDITDYIVRRLEPALERVHSLTGRKVTLLGYCMGGLLAVAQAIRRPELINGMILLATPWDFQQGFEVQRALLDPLWEQMKPAIEAQGNLSVDNLQTLFSTFDPDLTIRKYMMFGGLPEKSPLAKEFVLLEDWANDGVPLVKRVAIECLEGWWIDNAPALGQWRIDGEAVRPKFVTCPSFVVIPERDRIVTPASALALSQCLPKSSVLKVTGGHVGLLLSKLVGSKVHAPMSAVIKKWASGRE
jgi:polyhydroxyalkanoate synthase